MHIDYQIKTLITTIAIITYKIDMKVSENYLKVVTMDHGTCSDNNS